MFQRRSSLRDLDARRTEKKTEKKKQIQREQQSGVNFLSTLIYVSGPWEMEFRGYFLILSGPTSHSSHSGACAHVGSENRTQSLGL